MNGGEGPDSSLLCNSTPDSSTALSCRKRNRESHNKTEKRRKEKIKACIENISQLIPENHSVSQEKQSQVYKMERAMKYIQDLQSKCEFIDQGQGSTVEAEEIRKLNEQLNQTKAERDQLAQVIQRAGLDSEIGRQWNAARYSQAGGGTAGGAVVGSDGGTASSDSSPGPQEPSPRPPRPSRRRNTISSQLQSRMAAQTARSAAAMASTQSTVAPPGTIDLSGVQVPMLQGLQAGAPLLLGAGGGTPILLPGGQLVIGGGGDGGLLHLAMQSSGIAPSQPSPSPSTPPLPNHPTGDPQGDSQGEGVDCMEGDGATAALHTLASVASDSQNALSLPQHPPTPHSTPPTPQPWGCQAVAVW